MRFWCFHFEGVFSKTSTEYPEQGVFSSCLVPKENYLDAEFAFIESLNKRKINLLEIQESFLVDSDPDKMDPEIESNLYWIEWCEETEIAEKPTFEEFILYSKQASDN